MDVLSWNRSLTRELAHHDAHRLLDIGVVRADDGSLRLADDPSRPAAATVAEPGIATAVRALFRELRGVLTPVQANGPAISHS